MAETEGQLPKSDALAEASPESISYLLTKDPFQLTRKDRDRAVLALREQRARWAAAEAAGEHSKPKKSKVAEAAKSLVAGASAEDLGL